MVRVALILPLFVSGIFLAGCLHDETARTVTVTNTVVEATYSTTNEDGSIATLHVPGTTVIATLAVPE